MTMERLTKAAQAAGFAMVLNEDVAASAERTFATLPAIAQAPITKTALLLAKPAVTPSWTQQWRQWAQGATSAS